MSKFQIIEDLNCELWDGDLDREEMTKIAKEGIHYKILGEKDVDEDFFYNHFIYDYETNLELHNFIKNTIKDTDSCKLSFMFDNDYGHLH